MYLHPDSVSRPLPPYPSVWGVYFVRTLGAFRAAFCPIFEGYVSPGTGAATNAALGYVCPIDARDYWSDFESLGSA